MKNTLQEQKCKKIVIEKHFYLSFFRLYQFMRSSKFVIIEIRAHFKSENPCFLNLYSVHAARILEPSLEIMLSPLK